MMCQILTEQVEKIFHSSDKVQFWQVFRKKDMENAQKFGRVPYFHKQEILKFARGRSYSEK